MSPETAVAIGGGGDDGDELRVRKMSGLCGGYIDTELLCV